MAGVDIIPVYFLTSALFAGVLGLVVWALAVQLTGRPAGGHDRDDPRLLRRRDGLDPARRRPDRGRPATSSTSSAALSYDNTWADGWPWFKIASIFGTGFLPHRATTLGLPGLVAVVLLVVDCLGRRPLGVLLAGILAALLAPFQFYAFPATYLIVFLYVVTTGAWRARTVVRDAVLFLAPVVLAAPFIARARSSSRATSGRSIRRRLERGALRRRPRRGRLLLPDQPRDPVRAGGHRGVRRPAVCRAAGFLVAWMVALFIVPNVVVVSAVEFDMNKYFQIMWIAVAILAAWLIRRWPTPRHRGRAARLGVLAGAHRRSGTCARTTVTLSLPQEAAARWIAANTPDRSVFVTDAFINCPVDLAGRLRITTFGPYVSNLGYDPAPREADDTKAIYCDGPEVAAERMATYGATYVLSSGGVRATARPATDFSSSPLSRRSTTTDGVTSGGCAGREGRRHGLSPWARRRS